MSDSKLDPKLASILDSIRVAMADGLPLTADGDADPPGEAEDAATSPAPPRTVRGAPRGLGRTVEEFLGDLVRPHIKVWLDANLPELVQRAVAEEVARLTGNAPEQDR